ncbi:MAG: cytochrome c [Sphingomonadales bacterium]|nr:cytochrome c [Sphingomonadales bacterium]
MNARGAIAGLALIPFLLAGCSREARQLASDQPQTAPSGPADPRTARYAANFYQVSQGGRYFTWYGCGDCHGRLARGAANLANGSRHAVEALYTAIAAGQSGAHSDYAARVPAEQIWQMAAYLHDLSRHEPARNRRNALDQQGEPQGNRWQGPLQ